MARSYFLAMAISGAFAGLGGALDILGWQFRLGTLDVQNSTVGFIGIAVALLGRNTAIGVAFSALLFGALLYGTSSRSLDPTVFDPSLAGNLTKMIQALVLLFIGADVLILYLWHRKGMPRPRLPRFGRRHHVPPEATVNFVAVEHATSRPAGPPVLDRVRDWALARVPRGSKATGIAGIALAIVAFWIAVPPVAARHAAVPVVLAAAALALGAWTAWKGRRRLGITAMVLALAFGALGVAATVSSVGNLESVFVWGP